MGNFALNVPINSVSYGAVSIGILREIYKRGLSPSVFCIVGGADLSAQKDDQDFNLWLQGCLNKSIKLHKRTDKVFKLWHLNSCLDSMSKFQGLYFFHETNQPTEEELNAVNNQDVCFVSSQYTKHVFEEYGVAADKIKYCPPGFDDWNFHKTNKEYLSKDTIVFQLCGKTETRKATARIAGLWVKKFGNDKKYRLHLAIYNPFFRRQDGQQMSFEEQKALFIHQVFGGKNYWNVNFYPFLQKNAEFNDFLNCSQIDLTGLSLSEGFNLPLFQSLCLGKWAVVLNAHVHKDYCNANNSILVEPSSMCPAVDNMFFRQGDRFNQGSWFQWDDEAVISGMELACSKAHTPNVEGEKLREAFTFSRTVDIILAGLGI